MPGLIIDKVGGGNSNSNKASLKETSFVDLQTLADEDKLIPGSEYLLTDYIHKYFIEGSDSAGKKTFYRMSYNTGGWGVVGYSYDLLVGTEVIITELPEWYDGGIQVGDAATVTAQSSYYYFQFSNGLQWVDGARFMTAEDRYINIPQNIEVNDANGRPIMRPGGIINTEVHDGEAYMEMTAEENHAVVPEQLILTADSTNSFAVKAKSVTYPGDVLDYYFKLKHDIKNDNDEIIGTRNGYLYRRVNENYNIDLSVDWRVQRYRRWTLNLDSRTKFLNQNLDPNTTRIGYQGKFLFTSSLRTKEDYSHFYIGSLPEGKLMCLDENAMKTTFQYEVEGLEIAKDYPVFPLTANLNPGNSVSYCKVEFFTNTVFQGLSGTSGSEINVEAESIHDSTFVSRVSIAESTKATLSGIIAIDRVRFNGTNLRFTDCNILSYLDTRRASINSTYQRCIFATMQNGVRIDGYSQLPVAWWLFITNSNSVVNGSVFSGVMPYMHLENTSISDSSFFFYHSFNSPSTPNDGEYLREVIKLSSGVFSNVGLRITGLCDRVLLNNMIFPDANLNRVNGLFLYDILESVSYKNIKKNETTDALYFESLDADYNRTFTEMSSQTANPIDLTVGIVVDNAAPIIGNNVVFSITASNNLVAAGTNVIVNSLLPVGYTYVSDDVGANYDDATGIWTLGDLAISANDILNITATVEAAGPYQVDVTISSDQTENVPGDNAESEKTIPVAAINDLSTTIAVDNAAPVIGNNVVFTITGNNNGNKPATNVQATSLLPAGYTYVSDDSAANYDNVTGIWTVGSLAIAASDIINITATVEAAGPYQVDVSITGSESEDMPVDNTDTITPVPTA